MKITFIGVGDMGSHMVPHLAKAGYDVVVWDKVATKMTALAGDHVRAANSLEDAVTASKIVITSVMSADVPALHIGTPEHPGIVHYLQPGSSLLVTSTLDPRKITAIQAVMPANTTLLDVPMIGGVKYAREANLVLIAAGDKQAVDAVLPVLKTFGTVKYVGEQGNGAKLKLITNVAIMAAEAGIRETLDLADAYGIDYATTLDLLQMGPLKPVVIRALDESNPRPLKDSVADEVELDNATKDFVDLPIASAAMRRLQKAVDSVAGEAQFIDITNKKTALPDASKK
ncbi:3-hydroxyisobutyrate dehydrogenase [Lacticaseibacillus chiayiensis]|uniref:3-hydroxyisobutyrate dehydrogenase n=1 Tax=Lacticaseibacillus chiayiensis TaxID=2100821 RepID=A0A4Q1TK78_9LACO|nr:NAD(P)-binding domain-containing protein [Lacticaseibacillus chiayiensis]QVI34736.1 NAD(P)-dependent oxidoreductase [Lacticaseibacillus chiayiensis]RXT18949.1 3-hydroxyisobutyrate dehydrogenase [Lacticaseibacillus chiayiensis]RXT58507.1 3-hydroxyisobutyrate dehydrogenase [Lacticaseibacillus chiayiensis]UYN56486.1 NAD(P)-binding domain-containing protein [Lacticaseibacillus chiayiensis]